MKIFFSINKYLYFILTHFYNIINEFKKMTNKILIINGPNLQLLVKTFKDLEKKLTAYVKNKNAV